MPRRPPIRVRSQDRATIKKLNSRVSSKKSRLRKDGLEVLGFDTKGITDFQHRDEFNEYVKKMNQFTQRNFTNYEARNQDGAILEGSTIKGIKRAISRVNRIKKKAFKEVMNEPFTHRGEDTDLTAAEQKNLMGDTRFDTFKPLKFNPNRYRDQKEALEHLADLRNKYRGDFMKPRNKRYKENYLKALESVFGEMADPLIERIKDMPLDQFIKKYYTENIANIGFIYDYLDQKVKYEELEGVFAS